MTLLGSVDNQNVCSGSPSLALPKGGGAIRGIGETFQANQFTGTGSFTVPIPISPGRSGFGPSFSLQYSSGNGNGVFGLGWELSIPQITRKTEKGLPKYNDEDIFVLSGAEDLVPQFRPNTTTPPQGSFTIERFRPRTEGLFARVERWTSDTGDIHWRVTTRDNVTNIYGRSIQARITDAFDVSAISDWLLEETFDAKGNHIHYEYAADDPNLKLHSIFEEHRRYNQRYLRRICYGNIDSDIQYADGSIVGVQRQGIDHSDRISLRDRRYVFEIVFDYGDGGSSQVAANGLEYFSGSVPVRADAFSSFRSGFEVRTLRLCQRVLMYHHFAELNGPTCVRSTTFGYQPDERTLIAFLSSVTMKGHRPSDSGSEIVAEMPPIAFRYAEFKPENQRYRVLEARGNDFPSFALSGPDVALVDLFGDGLPDILQTNFAGFRYWKNLGDGMLDHPRFLPSAPIGLSLSQPEVSLADMDGDGRIELLLHGGFTAGYYEATPDGAWANFVTYDKLPSFSLSDPNLRLVDLTGDGRSDALLTRDHHFLWFECLGETGYSEPRAVERLNSLEDFPDIYFDDPLGRLRLADMTGDGLTDIVLLHKGRVDYWPNLGYGRFGARITMGTVPDPPMADATFDPHRLFLVDLDGTGCADLVYVDFDRVHFWLNQSGNAWSSRQTIRGTPITHTAASVQFADVFGTGTATLLWSYNFGLDVGSNYKALDFCGGVKPYVLFEMDNNMGATTRVRYAPSTKFALADRLKGKPWVTHLPFPVHVVEKVETFDHINKTKLVTSYDYHHGYFDGRAREFRGFGRVDRLDTEFFNDFDRYDLHGADVSFVNSSKPFHMPPVLTKTWHHTGAYFNDARQLLERYASEFYDADSKTFTLAEHEVDVGDSAFEAYRVLRGAVLRTEIFALDSSTKQQHPYLVTGNRHSVKNLQRHGTNVHGVYATTLKESISHHYERNPADPRIAHQINLATDELGNVTDQVSIAYPRREPEIPEQSELKILYTKKDFINSIDQDSCYLIGVVCQTRVFEIMGIAPTIPGALRTNAFDPVSGDILQPFARGNFLELGDVIPNTPAKRLVAWNRTYFRTDASAGSLDLTESRDGRLPLGQIEALGLPYESYTTAFNAHLISVFGQEPDGLPRVSAQMLRANGYRQLDDVEDFWWLTSGRQSFDASLYFQPSQFLDPLSGVTTARLDKYALFTTETVDALQNEIVANYDYRVLYPSELIDPNGARSLATYDALGLVTATAVQGHSGEGDLLDGLAVDLSKETVRSYLHTPNDLAADLLSKATTRMVYDLHSFRDQGLPIVVSTIAREHHFSEQEHSSVQQTFSYCDGFGRSVQTKVQAEPGPTPERDSEGRVILIDGDFSWRTMSDPRWVTTGATILNNKGKAVRSYEPYFSDTHGFEFGRQVGVSPTIFYDALGRVVATLRPNHTYEKLVFNSWRQETWDTNDTATQQADRDTDVGPFFAELPGDEYLPTWYETRISGIDELEKKAAESVEAHENTPTVTYLDTLGRCVRTITDTGTERLVSTTSPDIFGKVLEVTDARGVTVFQGTFDLAGRTIVIASPDAGAKYLFTDVTGKTCRSWDAQGNRVRSEYDVLQRLIQVWVSQPTGLEALVQQIEFGEAKQQASVSYHRTRIYRSWDEAGFAVNLQYDFKGNLLRSQRTLTKDYSKTPDWSTSVELEASSYLTDCTFDALNRIIRRLEPDGSIYEPGYNKANLIETVSVTLPDSNAHLPIVTSIKYNARGQRLRQDLANNVTTTFDYDPQTFRLRQVESERNGELLQNVQYTYDTVGNITAVYDAAFDQVFNNNQRIEPLSRYVYDATYRLIESRGREHTAIEGCADYRGDQKQTQLVISGNPQPIDNGHALRNYTESYEYDDGGNLEVIRHMSDSGGWTRRQSYESNSNRLTTSDAGCPGEDRVIPHNPNGNITKLPHVSSLAWNYANRLTSVALNSVNDGRSDVAFYNYDPSGARFRTVVERGLHRYERLYLGAVEIYREYHNEALKVARNTVNIMFGDQRLALIDVRTDTPESPSFRYQLGNHLGSSMRELDEQGRTITYEEYYPYGGTAFMAGTTLVNANLKRYRYCGKERDDETGLYYYGTRYFAPWTGRWISCDPIGNNKSSHPYSYAFNNPICFFDPDGNFPAPYEIADAMVETGFAPIPGLTGERIASYASSAGSEVGGAITHALPSDSVGGALAGSVVKTTFDVVGGIVAGTADPLSVVRGVMRLGTGSAEGVNDLENGNKVLGGSRIVGEVAQAIGIVAFGVGAARAAGVPGTYRPTTAPTNSPRAPIEPDEILPPEQIASTRPTPQPVTIDVLPAQASKGAPSGPPPPRSLPAGRGGPPVVTKGGGRVTVTNTTTPRTPSQNQLMGGSAKDLAGRVEAQHLHLTALCLGGPQAASNLVLGSSGANFTMLPFELSLSETSKLGNLVETDVSALVIHGTNYAQTISYRAWINGELVLDGTLDAWAGWSSDAERAAWTPPNYHFQFKKK